MPDARQPAAPNPPSATRATTVRRRFLGAALGVAGAVVAAGAGFGVAEATESDAATGSSAGNARVPFYGAHQAGIATPAQDRLAFAAFDVTSTRRRWPSQAMLGTWAAAGGADDRRASRSAPVEHQPAGAADRHRRGARARPGAAHDHRRVRPLASSTTGSGWPRSGRPRWPTSRRCPATTLQPDSQRRRPLRAGLLRRPAGRLPRDPQLRPARPRHRGDALVAARLRPHVLDLDRAADRSAT